MAALPISSQRRATGSPIGCLVAFFALFALAGAAALYAMLRSLKGPFDTGHLTALIPLVFLVIGAGGIVWALRLGRQASRMAGTMALGPSAVSPFGVPLPASGLGDPASIELRPAATPLGKFIGIALVALFWNGIVSVAAFQAFKGWRTGSGDGCLTLFLIPFVLVGAGLLFGTVQQLLILFNPRVRLTLAPGVLMTGGMSYLQWRLTGRGAGVRRLRIVLEGREEARYRRGTNTATDRQVFAAIAVADTAQPFEIPAGSARIDVPAATLPSFTATHNKIVWSLKVTCEIPRWPDSADEYEVLIRPGPGRGGLA
jgi:hypothetical protein